MSKYKYRIKTEQEFINEFGVNWREIVSRKFPIGMDYLLGKNINNIYKSNVEGRILGNFSIPKIGDLNTTIYSSSNWVISIDMVKEIKCVEYNNKRKLVYE